MHALSRLTLLAWLAAVGCSSYERAVEPPPPIVERAPPAVAHLAIHVFQLIQPPATPEDERDYHNMPGYTEELRRLFQAQLQQAGFTVVLDRATPADLVATIQSDMPHEKPGVATLLLTRDGQVVDRLSVPVRVSGEPGHTVHHASEAAVRLVEALERSERVAEVARAVAAKPPAAVAGQLVAAAAGDCPAPTESLPPEPQPVLAECALQRSVHCQEPSPVRSAWQPPPFVACPREIPAFVADVLKQPGRFSALETRKARLAGACGTTPPEGVCCYVQFNAVACD